MPFLHNESSLGLNARDIIMSYIHPIFNSKQGKAFKADLPLDDDELITFTTMAYQEQLEPAIFFGTSKGCVLIFPLFYKNVDHEMYFYYHIQFGSSPVTFILPKRAKLFISASINCKFGAYIFTP